MTQPTDNPASSAPDRDIWDDVRDRPAPPRRRLGRLIGFSLVCGLIALATGVFGFGFLNQLRAKYGFVETTGKVISSRLIVHQDTPTGLAYVQPRIIYEYDVAGQTYTADRFTYGAFWSADVPAMHLLVSAYPAGAVMPVFYDASHPSRSVLTRDIQGTYWFLLLALQPFWAGAAALAGLVLAIPHHRRERVRFLRDGLSPPCDVPGWGTARRHGSGVTFSGAHHGLLAMTRAYAIVCGLSIIVLVFTGFFAHQPGLFTHPQAVWITVGLAAMAGGAAALWSLVRRPTQLVVDMVQGRVRLDSVTRHLDLPLEEISEWTLQRVVTLGRPSQTGRRRPTLAPLLCVGLIEGPAEPLHIFGPDANDAAIALRLTDDLARLTGKPLECLDDEPQGSPAELRLLAHHRHHSLADLR